MTDLTDIAKQIGHGWATTASLVILAMLLTTLVSEWRDRDGSNKVGVIVFASALLGISYWLGG